MSDMEKLGDDRLDDKPEDENPEGGKKADPTTFEREIASVINRFSRENESNTPDWILAEYLSNCLINFNQTSRAREKWYGKSLSIQGDG